MGVSIKKVTEQKGNISKEQQIKNRFKRATGILPSWVETSVSDD